MFRFIFRQRRRILTGGLFSFLSMLLAFSEAPEFYLYGVGSTAMAWVIFILAISIMTLGMMVVFALFIALFKRWRFLVELIPVFTFLVALFEPVYDTLPVPGAVGPFAWFAGWMLFFTFVYGTGLDDYRSKLAWRSRRTVSVAMAPEALWPRLETAVGRENEHWTPILHEVRATEDPRTFDVLYKMGPSIFQHQTQTVLARDENVHFRYHFTGDTAPGNSALADGIFDIRLEPKGESETRLTLEMDQQAMLPRDALSVWFDDLLGDQLDSLRARLAGKRDWSVTGLMHREIMKLS